MKKNLVAAGVIALAMAGLTVWWRRPPTDPVINGLRLSEWLERRSPWTPVDEQAIRASGPDAGRYLGYVIRKNRPLDENGVVKFIRYRSRTFARAQKRSYEQCFSAVIVLTRLGPSAESAIPDLLSLLDSSYPDETFPRCAAVALHSIGPASWDEVDDALKRGSPMAKKRLLWTITARFTPPTPAPSDSELSLIEATLERCCRDPDAEVREAANHALKVFRTELGRSTP